VASRILLRGDTAANWTSVNPILAAREEGIETDTKRRKIGDGATAWLSLPYATVTPGDLDDPTSAASIALRAAFAALTKVAATVTVDGAAVVNKLNPVDASGAARTITLPTGQAEGTLLSVEKIDATSNAVSVTGNMRGVAAQTIPLTSQYESRIFLADSAGSWHPFADHRTKASLDASYGRMFTPEAYGATGDGSTDDSAAVQAAIQAAYSAGGGTVLFAAKTYRINSQLALPNDGHTTRPRQAPLILRGAGAVMDGSWQASGVMPGGTVLDLRSTAGPAKIDTRGLGLLVIEHLTLTQAGSTTDTNPFIQTTNTTLHIRDTSFYGHPSVSGQACVQDAIVLGGTTTTVSGSATAPFQGYGTVLQGNYFARIRRGIYGRTWANSVFIVGNTWSNSCGATTAEAALQFDGTNGFAKANTVIGNLFETGGYPYVVRLTNSGANQFYGNAFWDNTGLLQGCYLIEGPSSNCSDNFIRDIFAGPPTALWLSDQSTPSGSNVTIGSGRNQLGSTLAGGDRKNIVQPALATANENAVIWAVNRSLAEATNPGQDVWKISQSGGATLGGSWAATANIKVINAGGQVSIDHTSLVKSSGDLQLFPGNDQPYRRVQISRGVLQLSSYATASRPAASNSGAGACIFDTTLGKPIWSNGTAWVDATGTAA
jgi:hypothetical protein